MTPEELARRTGTVERLVREWLSAHAAAGYLDYDATTGRFAMNPEQAMVFGNPDSPVYMLGSFEVCQAVMVDQPKVSKAFRNGGAAGYHERCNCLFSGMSRFFGVSYKAHLRAGMASRTGRRGRKTGARRGRSPISAAAMAPRPF